MSDWRYLTGNGTAYGAPFVGSFLVTDYLYKQALIGWVPTESPGNEGTEWDHSFHLADLGKKFLKAPSD
jgi:hypothetical protein